MATLVPANLDVSSLEPSERRCVEALVERTGPEWLVLPHVPFVECGNDGEADLVVVHPALGVVVLEVKGGLIECTSGLWYQAGRPLRRSPVDQAADAKHVLLRKVKAVRTGIDTPWFVHGVVFPDMHGPPRGLTPDLDPTMVLTADSLEWPEEALRALLAGGHSSSSGAQAVVRTLRPDLSFGEFNASTLVAMSRWLDRRTEEVLRTVENLDVESRVYVTGPAGCGKSRLAIRWAHRASGRGEKVLLFCFNRPMGAVFASAFEDDPNVTAGSFHDLAGRLLASTGFTIPRAPSKEFFDDELPAALIDRRESLGRGFDTIILDEAQDIRPHWWLAIENLLDPDGADRLYRLSDPAQNVYRIEPEEDTGWVHFPLAVNCRNTKSIAQVAETLGGAPTFPDCPVGTPVRVVRVGGLKEVRKQVKAELSQLLGEHELPPSSIAVITTRADLRDQILDPPLSVVPLGRWDERDESLVVCETAHRLKGTEYEAAVVVNLESTDKAWLREVLYVAVSRPRSLLTLVATDDTAALLGL